MNCIFFVRAWDAAFQDERRTPQLLLRYDLHECQDPPPFFPPFSWNRAQLLRRTSARVMRPCYYSVSWQVIFCQMKCWIASCSPRKAEMIHVSRIKLLYSILQPRWDCGCSSIFNKCLFPRGPCWALWVNSVQEGKACSPHSGAL